MNPVTLERILYVDDEPDIRAVAQLSLELVGGFTLCLCASGAEALDKAASFRPDLFLLDVMMPELDGPSTLARLRRIEAFAATPVVFMTAKAQPSEIRQFRELGALDVIVKPFQPIQLPDQLKQIWRLWRDQAA